MDDYYDVSLLQTQEFKFCMNVFLGFLSVIILFSTLSIYIHESTITTEMRSAVVTDAMDIVTLPTNLTTKISAEFGNIVQNIASKAYSVNRAVLTQYGTDKTAVLMAYSQDDMENMKTVAFIKSLEGKGFAGKEKKLAKYKAGELKALKNINTT